MRPCKGKTDRTGSHSRVFIFCLLILSLLAANVCAGEGTRIDMVYLMLEPEAMPALSNLDPVIRNDGLHGARLGIADNNTTGTFTGHVYGLEETVLPSGADAVTEFRSQLAQGRRYFVLNLPAPVLAKIASLPESADALLFDVGTRSDALRSGHCGSNLFHMLPSRAMRADALAQYMLKKRWRDWLLIVGPDPADRLYAAAVRRAARRYGMEIVAEKEWSSHHDSRRTARSEVPLLTQESDYDVVLVADEKGLFGEYLSYRTWLPRPVAGTQGLVAVAWHSAHEQWGAVQLQNRFAEAAGRRMSEADYAAWLAVRAVGEAVTRSPVVDSVSVKAYILGENFSLAGFKGRSLSFRNWSGQLRQPVLLSAPRSLVAVAPLEGFLHPGNELDSLGYDRSETSCKRK